MYYLTYINSFFYLRGFHVLCTYFLALVTAAYESSAAQTHQLQLAVLMELNSCMRGKETLLERENAAPWHAWKIALRLLRIEIFSKHGEQCLALTPAAQC